MCDIDHIVDSRYKVNQVNENLMHIKTNLGDIMAYLWLSWGWTSQAW